VTEVNRVASRWIAEGTNRGRHVRLWGITISRVDGGEIVEDWSASDTLRLVGQLGPRRLVLLGLDRVRARRSRSAQ
jgi:predicted ester cyclase